MPTLTTRVPDPILQEIDLFSRGKHMDRSTALRNLIARGLKEEKREQSLEKYRKKEISLQKLGEILHITYLDALDLIEREGLHLDYGLAELQEDLKGNTLARPNARHFSFH